MIVVDDSIYEPSVANTMDEPPVAKVAPEGAPGEAAAAAAAAVDDLEVPELPEFDWKTVGKAMMSRRAYRRYHGSHRTSFFRQNWGISLLFLFTSGFYAIKSGSLRALLEPASPEGASLLRTALDILPGESLFPEAEEDVTSTFDNPQGMVVILVWQGSGSHTVWVNCTSVLTTLVIMFLLIKYQRDLEIKYAGYVTLLAGLLLAAGALRTAIGNDFPYDFKVSDLWGRVFVVVAWTFIQMVFLCIGFVIKVVLPYLSKEGKWGCPKLKSSNLYSGAVEKGMEEIWKRVPNLRDRLLHEYAAQGTPLYSFCGEYYHIGRRWCATRGKCCGSCFAVTDFARYVGGLDDNGAPHGLGVWHDTFKHGEMLVGRFMHGLPIPPFRVRTNTGSAFLANRIAMLSCRTDSVKSRGNLQAFYGKHRVDGGPEPAPMQAAIASLECNTSGMFYKGFPKIEWLQMPVALEKIEHFKGKRMSKLKSMAPPLPFSTSNGAHALPAAVEEEADVPSEASKKVDDKAPESAEEQHASRVLRAGCLSADAAFPGSLGCFGNFSKARRKKDKEPVVWAPHLDAELIGQPLSTWLLEKQYTSLDCVKARSMRLRPESEAGYDALFFVHGYNSSLEHVLGLLGQLLAFGSFPGDLMPVIFGWPCTKSYQYLWGHKITQSDYVATKMLEALQHLEADGCRRLHIVSHSMGARTVAGSSERLSQFFPTLPADSPGFPKTLPPKTTKPVATSKGLELASVTFLSPDMDYGEYVGRCAPRLRSVCPLVTIYGDENDSALGISQFMNSWWYGVHPESRTPGLKQETLRLGVPLAKPLGRHCDTCIRGDGEVLDVDFVSTTFLSSNVHTVRHNYFHLNREMVDDIRDLMVTGRRAAERPYRLEWIAQHTYGFVVAPSYVVAA